MGKSKRGFGCVYQRKKELADGSVVFLPTWWIKYPKNGRTFYESSRSKVKADAERLLKERLGDIATGRFGGLAPERMRIRELFDEVTRDYRDNGKASIKHVERRLKLHLIPAFGHMRVAEFGTSHVRAYTAKRRRAGAANATINRELAIVKRAFHMGAQMDPPVVNRIPYIPMLAENNIRKGFVEADVYVQLLRELPAHLRPVFVVGYHTGARIGELLRLAVTSGPISTPDCARARNDEEQGRSHAADLRVHDCRSRRTTLGA